MPLLRYFAYVGGALVMLLIAADALLPKADASRDRVDIDRSIIRIRSQQAMAGPIIFGTVIPAPVVAALPEPAAVQKDANLQVAAAEPVAPAPPVLESLAQMPAVAKPKKTVRPRRQQTAKGPSRQVIAASAPERSWGFFNSF